MFLCLSLNPVWLEILCFIFHHSCLCWINSVNVQGVCSETQSTLSVCSWIYDLKIKGYAIVNCSCTKALFPPLLRPVNHTVLCTLRTYHNASASPGRGTNLVDAFKSTLYIAVCLHAEALARLQIKNRGSMWTQLETRGQARKTVLKTLVCTSAWVVHGHVWCTRLG